MPSVAYHPPGLRLGAYQTGALVTVTGAVTLSTGALLIRHIDSATAWQIIFYRSIGLFTGLCLLFWLRRRADALPRLGRSWRAVLMAGPFQGTASIFFILALMQTSTAAAMLPMSSAPVIAAVLARLILGESVSRSTMLALVGVGTGVFIMTVGGTIEGNLVGSAYAIANTIAYATYIVFVRRASRFGVDMLPAVILGSMIAGTADASFTPSYVISTHDLLICLIWGGIVQCAGVACIIFGARFLTVAETSILIVIESASGPLLVWIFLGEVAGQWSVVGGIFVLVVVFFWSSRQIRHSRQQTFALIPAGLEPTGGEILNRDADRLPQATSRHRMDTAGKPGGIDNKPMEQDKE
jgi:drug/metabolite transporter (DMT)-like permease